RPGRPCPAYSRSVVTYLSELQSTISSVWPYAVWKGNGKVKFDTCPCAEVPRSENTAMNRHLAGAALLLLLPSPALADAFDHYTNDLLAKATKAAGTQRLKELT